MQQKPEKQSQGPQEIEDQNSALSGGRIVIKALIDQGVTDIFGYPGGAVLPLYDELFKDNKLQHILVRHEQGAVHMAEGYARSTGRVGVVLVTSGPGATNAVTGLTDALMDSIPIVCLSGQVPTHLIGNDAFQECDTTGITRSCTKHNYLVKDVNCLAKTVHEAFYIARSGRPGPVLIDLPKDVLIANGRYTPRSKIDYHSSYRPVIDPDTASIEAAADLIQSASRPIYYVGGGVINAGEPARRALYEIVAKSNAPCTLTLMGLGAFPASEPQYLGMLGMHGSYEANLAMHGADVIIALGSRFDDRVTGRLNAFAPQAKIIHCDIDPSSINKNVKVDLPIVGHLNATLPKLADSLKKRGWPSKEQTSAWWKQIEKWRGVNCFGFDHSDKVIKPQHAIRRLQHYCKDRPTIITTEVGQHQMWAAQHFHFDEPMRWLTSGGLGTMGYGLPAAIGAQIAHPEKLVIDISGEASFQMNMQELGTAKQYNLPIKVFIINNRYMGMVRQWQEMLHGGRYSHSYSDSLPDFVALAKSFGGVGMRAETPDELEKLIPEMLAYDKFVVADIVVDPKENCYPMIPSGAAHNEILLSAFTTIKPVPAVGRALV